MRRRLRVLAAIATLICLILSLDMAIGGSVFHPLTHLYKLQSWLTCKSGSIASCNNTAQNASSGTPVPGRNGMVVTEQRLASEVGESTFFQPFINYIDVFKGTTSSTLTGLFTVGSLQAIANLTETPMTIGSGVWSV
jgi:hypothetical protein